MHIHGKTTAARLAGIIALLVIIWSCEQKSAPEPEPRGVESHMSDDLTSTTDDSAPANQERKLEANTAHPPNTLSQKALDRISEQMIERMWQLFPTWAIHTGYYDVADQLAVPDTDHRRKVRAFANSYLHELTKLNPAQMNDDARTDLSLIISFLNKLIWKQKTFKNYEWDPSIYNVSHGFETILNTEYAPLDERLRTFSKRLQKVPAYYAAAQQNIKTPAAPQLILAIQQNEGAMSTFDDELREKVAASGLSNAEKDQFNQSIDAAREAIEEYITFLQMLHAKLEKEDGFRDYRIGKKLYAQKYGYDIQSTLNPQQLYELALKEKGRLHDKMEELADKLWPKTFEGEEAPEDRLEKIRQILEKLSLNHATKENFKQKVEEQIPELAAFVSEHDLLSLDKEKPLRVRTTPPYMRGFSVASINAPGPYDKKANTYYNVMPIAEMEDDTAESLLREYNTYLMQVLNIHEAIPGHYTQLVYANESPSLIKSILGNGAMIEGWAVYAERMMLEAGYGDFQPELWMMYYKWHLRTVINTILDYSIQVKGMQEQEALDLMINQGFQQRAEAMGKWRRATLSQVQLTSYFAGYMDIMTLRADYKEKLGDKFDLKTFHEKFLSYGNAPVPVIRELMMAEVEPK
ncbi:DUF885 domain-containing protein [Microbulbifer sp.]|uniref:DUF885 domain-containing protein n=1 Tax=Microbulbifer sp. TaxID=1908541 RepID=UPI00258F2C2A|nr:DUF885 domain-containing protein [Microbulbifer sp.]